MARVPDLLTSMEFAKQPHQQPEPQAEQSQGKKPDDWSDPFQSFRIDIPAEIAQLSARQALYQDPNAAHVALAAFTPPHDAASGTLSSQQRIENAQALERLVRGAQGIADVEERMFRDTLQLLR
jgi:hypothetical protein